MLSTFSFTTTLKALCICFSAYIIYGVYRLMNRHVTRRCKAAAYNCLSPPRFKVKDPLFGLDFLWEGYKSLKRNTALEDMRKQYMSTEAYTASARVLGTTFISTIEPLNVKAVLSTNFKDWELDEDRIRSLRTILGEGIFVSDGPAWQHSRDMLRPYFVKSRVNNAEMFEKHATNLIRAIPSDGVTMVDLQPLFFSASLDIATEFLIGKSTGCLDQSGRGGRGTAEKQDVEKFVEAFTYLQNSIVGKDSRFGILGLFLPDWKQKRYINTLNSFVDNLIRDGIVDRAARKTANADPNRYVFLDELLEQTNDLRKIRSELLNILSAGRDATASFLSNVWFELSRRPLIWSRLQQEISVLPTSNPSFEELKGLRYLQAIFNESQRLYPVVPENARQAAKDTILPLGGGRSGKSPVFVPKGQIVHWSVYAMHRRKDIYGPDAEDFNPERWLDTSEHKGLRVGWEYLPFNGGPRICLGQQFALTEAAYITVRLMQQFKGIQSMDLEPWREDLTIVCTGLGGCKVVLTPRQ